MREPVNWECKQQEEVLKQTNIFDLDMTMKK